MSRSRVIAADRERVWRLVSDPHSLPRWWPRTSRVEDVREGDGGLPAWTTVLETEAGKPVRADYRCTASEPLRSLRWEQEVVGTPFERILRHSTVELTLDEEGAGTRLTVGVDEVLRGLSRLGSPLIGGAAKHRLDDALDGVARALGR